MDFTKFCTTSRKKKDQPQSSNAQITSAVSETITKPESADSSVVSNIPPMQNFDQFVEERKIPIANQIDLTGHSKAVSCISIEPAGNRVVTGSYDYAVKIYDFGGMDSRHRPFQSIEAQESHMVVSVSHSPSGDRFIAATGSAQPKVFDRDGKELIKFVRGDMYLRDLSNTKGHTMEVTGVMWHPTEKEIVLTCSMDGSLRVWDLQGETTFGNLINRHVLKVRGLVSANRVGVTSCCYSPSGQKIIGGCADGSVHIWLEKRVYSKADIVLRYDLFATKDITSVTIHKDNNTLAMRCTSGHVALWDIRSEKTAKTPVKILPNLPNDYPTANVTFSPDGTLLCCGTSPVTAPMTVSAPVVDVSSASGGNSSSSAAKSTTDTGTVAVAGEKGELKSRLYFYDVASTATSPSLSIALEAGSTAIMVRWHPSTNQILCTMSSGVTRVLYDPLHSKKGALLSASKAPKRIRDGTDFAGVGEIYNPLALPMYRTDMPGDTKKRKAELKDPYLAKIPAKPVPTGPGNRANNNFFFTNYVMKDRVVDQSRTIDPREALLSVDAETKADPKIFGKAYGTTQPNAQLHSMTFEAEQEEFKKNQKKL